MASIAGGSACIAGVAAREESAQASEPTLGEAAIRVEPAQRSRKAGAACRALAGDIVGGGAAGRSGLTLPVLLTGVPAASAGRLGAGPPGLATREAGVPRCSRITGVPSGTADGVVVRPGAGVTPVAEAGASGVPVADRDTLWSRPALSCA